MLLRKRLHAAVPRDRPRVLPQVQEVLPLARRGQDAVDNRDFEIARLVDAGFGIRRGGHRQDPRAFPARAPFHAVVERLARPEFLDAVLDFVVADGFRGSRLQRDSFRSAAYGRIARQRQVVRLAAPYGDRYLSAGERLYRRGRRGGSDCEHFVHVRFPFLSCLPRAPTGAP